MTMLPEVMVVGESVGGGGQIWGPCRMSNLRNANVPCHLNGHVPCPL